MICKLGLHVEIVLEGRGGGDLRYIRTCVNMYVHTHICMYMCTYIRMYVCKDGEVHVLSHPYVRDPWRYVCRHSPK